MRIMRVIISAVLWYIAIGMIIGLVIAKTAMKYKQEIEDRINEEIDKANLKALVVLTVITWPKTIIRFSRIILVGIMECIKQIKNQEG